MEKPWSRQRLLKGADTIPTMGEMRQRILAVKNKRDRVFLALSYLTAGRTSEVIGIRKEDLTMGIKKDRRVLLVHMRNKKSRKKPWKDIIVPVDREKEMIDEILGYISNKEGGLFGFSTVQRAWQIMKEHLGCNTHWVRHVRLTHLVTVYDFNDRLLVRWAGWESAREARHYMELRVGDFLDKM